MSDQLCRRFGLGHVWFVAVAALILFTPHAKADKPTANGHDLVTIQHRYAEFDGDANRFDFNALRGWYARNLADDYTSRAIGGGALGTRTQILGSLPGFSKPKESNALLSAQFPKSTTTIIHVDDSSAGRIVVTIRLDEEVHSQGGTAPGSKPAKRNVLNMSEWRRETWQRTPKGLQITLTQVVAIRSLLDGRVMQNFGTIPR